MKVIIETLKIVKSCFIIDFIQRSELNPDGSTTTFTDFDADGVWDTIVTTP